MKEVVYINEHGNNMADLNTLMQQTEARSQALSQQADRAIETVNRINKIIVQLNSTVATASQSATESFNTLSKKSAEVEQGLQTESDQAKASLDSLQAQIDQTQQQAETIATELKNRLDEAGTQVNESRAKLTQDSATTKQGLESLIQQSIKEYNQLCR